MNILIVDGNEKEASDRYISLKMDTQFDVYRKILNRIGKEKLNITIIHPAYSDNFIPKGVNLDDFDGIAWTGSLLNIYDMTPPIVRQIELAKILLNKKNIIFGSCWGLQVLTTALGGNVRKNPKGLEAVIARNIQINDKGMRHSMYEGKPKKFDSFCWHYDEVDKLPPNSVILSSNDKSNIQAVKFENKLSEVWAVQYHPEFDPVWMSGLMNQRKSILIKDGIYNSESQFNNYKNYFEDIEKYKSKKNKLLISESLINENIRIIELSNWIKKIKNIV